MTELGNRINACCILGLVFLSPLAGWAALDPIIPPIAKEQNNWCWAASDKMIMQYYITRHGLGDPILSQCQIASTALSRDCCARPGDCDRVGLPTLGAHGYSIVPQFISSWPTTRRWISMTGEIIDGRPFLLTWRWKDNTSHIVVGTAWGITGGSTNAVGYNNSNGYGDYVISSFDYFIGGPTYDHSSTVYYSRISKPGI